MSKVVTKKKKKGIAFVCKTKQLEVFSNEGHQPYSYVKSNKH